MKNLVIVVGKTFSGKSTYVNESLPSYYHRVKTHTTRPIRPTESGDEYYFDTKEDYEQKKADNLVIAPRDYDTVAGIWSYWFEESDLQGEKNVVILDLVGAKEAFKQLNNTTNVSVVYLNTTLEEIERRIKESSRGKTEDMSETQRRLASDVEEMAKLDAIVKPNGVVKDITWVIESEEV